MSAREDWELLTAWRSGDQAAGQDLVSRYMGLLTRFFHNKVRDHGSVADLVSETMLACTKGKDGIENPGAFRSYVFAVAMNQLRRHYSKAVKQRRELDDFEGVFVGEADGPQSMTSIVAHQQEAVLLVRALRKISLDQQIVFELNFLEGLSPAEIAALLGIPPFTVYTRLRRGKARLQQIVSELTENPQLVQSTMMGLRTWGATVREQIGS